VERVVLNALALDTDLLPDSCDEYRRYRKWNCAFGDYFLASPRHGEPIHLGGYSRASIALTRLNGSVANTLEFSRKRAVGFIVD